MRLVRSCILACLALVAAPAALRAEGPQCLDCHPDKREGTVVHAAVEMRCGSCHEGTHAGEKPFPKLIAPLPDLCFNCHDKAAFDKRTLHAPVAGGLCGSCHDPHAGGLPRMLAASVPDLCFTCHDKEAWAKKGAHARAAAVSCLACHDPHGSDAAFILTRLVESSCQTCHDLIDAKHVLRRISPNDAHPLKGRPDPLRPERELSCPSCHNPHAYDRERISTRGPAGPAALCLRCHRKVAIRP
jgi:predicted CXXCH cytochrome family protein